ncbi:MAG: Gfa-like protein [Alphaproteobacteria bacterium]|nr:Gfa-like protein [Alphaproteobacteria bacterium]
MRRIELDACWQAVSDDVHNGALRADDKNGHGARKMLEGRCLCGAITYQVSGSPIIVAHCYCRDCQRVSGAGHTTGAMFREEDIEVRGAMSEFTSRAESGSTVSHLFCARCSSRLFGKNTGMPGVMTLAVGTLNDPSAVTPEVAIFTRTRPRWEPADAQVESFDSQPAWKPPE